MFREFKEATQNQFKKMLECEYLFTVDVDKDLLWEKYLNSFPEGENKIFKERREYDCNCCKQFIRNCGNMVAIKDNKLISIWDIETKNIAEKYELVSKALSKMIKKKKVKNIFFSDQKKVGTDFNIQLLGSGETIRWEHFFIEVPGQFVNSEPGGKLSETESNKNVFKRSLDELNLDAIEIVLELIEQNSLYRGEEHKRIVETFLKHKKEYLTIKDGEKDNYCWINSVEMGGSAKFRNTAIGTLVSDISDGRNLDESVASFESKVAPSNYKRTSSLVTKGMIESAEKKLIEIDAMDSIYRRYATVDDLTINNILFADRSTKKTMSVFDELKKDAKVNGKSLDKVEEVSIEDFISKIIPKASKIEVMPENSHTGNFMSIFAPQNKDAKNIFKWNNKFSWAYNGDVTDSIKEKVKGAGGNIDAYMRFSIHWFNRDDLDAHCIEPNGSTIYFGNKRSYETGGFLDVDMNAGTIVIGAVENIAHQNKERIQPGRYKYYVHNFQLRDTDDVGFEAELEFNGQIYKFAYDKKVKDRERILVAEIEVSNDKNEIKFIKSLPFSSTQKEIWSVKTNTFLNANMIMHSPNHWDGENVGNKHYFFILDDCKNEDKARGFFNEFLREEFREHRKTFEILGSKTKVEPSDNQLSGLGFSSTIKNHLICKVHGSFERIIKIIF